MEPVVSQLEEVYAGALDVRTVNLFDEPAIADKYSIRVVPTLIIEDAGGKVLERLEGFRSFEEIRSLLKKHGIEPKEGC